MKKHLLSGVILAAMLSAGCEEDYKIYHYDTELEAIHGVWLLGEPFMGYSYEDQGGWVESDHALYRFADFSDDEHCRIVRFMYNNTVETDEYDYVFNGNSVSLMKDGAEFEKWLFKIYSNMDDGNKRTENLECCVEKEDYIVFRLMYEMRSDSTIAIMHPLLRGHLSVPQDRVWKTKKTTGYVRGVSNIEQRNLYRDFKKNNVFYECEKNKENLKKGKYEFVEGMNYVDTLYLHYEDGSELKQEVVYEDGYYYTYMNGMHDGTFYYGKKSGCPKL